jgi:hypothetical protein
MLLVPPGADSSFIINLYADIDYETAGQALDKVLVGKIFSSGNKSVMIDSVEIYGLQGYALICLSLAGSFNGRVYVYGRPQYDAASSTVSIEDLDFDLSTKRMGHKLAEWLLHGIILTKVKPYLKFSLREQELESQLMAQKMLCNHELMPNVFVTGSIDTLQVGGVTLTAAALRALIFARGSLSVMAR